MSPRRSQCHSRGTGDVVATQVDSDSDADDERLLSVPDDVVDALEADLAVDLLSLKCTRCQTEPQKSSKVVLRWAGEWFPQSADGTPRSHFDDSSSVEADAFDRHSQSTASPQEPPGDEAASSDTETIGGIFDVSMDGGTISEGEADPSVVEVSMGPALQDALRWLDTVDLTGIFCRRACVMPSPPRFLSGGTGLQ